LNELDTQRECNRDLHPPPEAETRPEQRDQNTEREEEHDIAPRVPHAETLGGRTPGQERGRTGQRRQTWTELKPTRTVGTQARASVRGERDGGKAGEIADEDQKQDFAAERQRAPTCPVAIHPKDQPAGNYDRAQDKDRKDQTAIRKKRIDKLAEHIGSRLVMDTCACSRRVRIITARTVRRIQRMRIDA